MSSLKDFHVAIVKHTYSAGGGMAQELVDYVLPRVRRVSYIAHPFPRAHMPLNSTLQVFDRGSPGRKFRTFAPWGPDVLFYLLDIFFTCYFVLRARQRIDLYIGLDNLNTFTGLILRRLGLVRTVVFYVIDYVPERFSNRRLNALYHWIDRFCCYHADCIWNVSDTMMEARRALWHSLDGVAPHYVVPLGCPFERIERLPVSQIDRHAVAFLGTLAPEQGVDLLLTVWPTVRESVPDATLTVIGGGEQAAQLQAQAARLGIAASVRFCGFVAEDTDVEHLLSRCAVGAAPYAEDTASFKYYADPGKVKLYLAAGLPVVITRVPPVARTIAQEEAGIAIHYDAGELSSALLRLLTDDQIYTRFRANAIRLAAQFSWEIIFGTALQETLATVRVQADVL